MNQRKIERTKEGNLSKISSVKIFILPINALLSSSVRCGAPLFYGQVRIPGFGY